MKEPPFLSRAGHFFQKKLGFFRQSYRQDFFGRTFVIPAINGRKTYISELWMADLIAALLRQRNGAFVDVGANLGQTLLKVAALEPDREYLGFEPNPACADYLFELVRLNKLHHIVIPAGLGPSTAVLKLNLYREESTDPSASLVDGFRAASFGSKPVVVIGWNDLPQQLRPQNVAIVKIDVEGGEREVLDGLRELMDTQKPFVLVEILPPHTADNHDRIERQEHIERTLKNLDYIIFRVRKGPDECFCGLKRVDGFGIHSDLGLSDYLLVHRQDLAFAQHLATV
ncbi:FkbM family methyltransferase [Erythrobacter sp.]|uniref:FkbM family methyltransferase n=1 Tax=Erythrobacter sp. TaxID=1042 RepID=UPI0025F53851|nr:FkbM family methyltransferase [Erythrobacter sp.]